VFQAATANDVEFLFVPARPPEDFSQWIGESSGNLRPALEANSDDSAGSVAELTLAITRASQFSPDAEIPFPARTYGKPGTLPKRSGKHRSQQSVFEIIQIFS
jgi:hypothetical protein